MSELPDGIEPAPIPEPKDSSLGIVARWPERGSLELLLGKRARDSRFMPGNLAFPGGRMDEDDQPGLPMAFERCVSREMAEETGLAIPPEAWLPAGERTTPPFFPVRFRTRFFVAALPPEQKLPASPPRPAELETLEFARPRDVLANWEAGRALVPPPLLPILRQLDERAPADAAGVAALVAALNATEDPHPRIEFTPGVWALPVRTRTLPPASCTNVWMPGGERFVVIDPGSDEPGELDKLLRIIQRRIDGGVPVEAVVLTHHHRDHVAGCAAIASVLSVPILAHEQTLRLLPALPPQVATRALADGASIDLGGLTLTVVHTPGHAPGHLAFFEPQRRVLIAGDLVSGLSTILVGLDGGDLDAYLDSLRRVAALAPKLVLPSHGPPLPGGSLAATIAHREAREAKIVAALRATPRPLAEIAVEAYTDAPEAPAFLREMQARAHLRRLERLGAAHAADDGSAWSI